MSRISSSYTIRRNTFRNYTARSNDTACSNSNPFKIIQRVPIKTSSSINIGAVRVICSSKEKPFDVIILRLIPIIPI